jgi:hypothetical protein
MPGAKKCKGAKKRAKKQGFESDAKTPHIGVSTDGQTRVRHPTPTWFRVPEAFGGGDKHVVSTAEQLCCCKGHTTTIFALEDNILVYHCRQRQTYVWRAKS